MSNRISDYTMEDLADRLMLTVCNYDLCSDSLVNFPHIRKGGLALYVQVATPSSKNIDGMYTSWLTVTNDRLNAWGISKEVLFDLAASSSSKLNPGFVVSIDSFLKNDTGLNIGDELPNGLIISNQFNFNGSASIFYDESLLKKACEMLEADSLTLFPVDVNQIFVFSDKSYDSNEKNEIRNMITEAIDEADRIVPDWLEYHLKDNQIADYSNNTCFEPSVRDESVVNTRHR